MRGEGGKDERGRGARDERQGMAGTVLPGGITTIMSMTSTRTSTVYIYLYIYILRIIDYYSAVPELIL